MKADYVLLSAESGTRSSLSAWVSFARRPLDLRGAQPLLPTPGFVTSSAGHFFAERALLLCR